MIKKKDKSRNVFECIEMDEIKKMDEKEFEGNSEDDKVSFNDLSQCSPSPLSKSSLIDDNKVIDNKLFESMTNINDHLKNGEINWFDDYEIDEEKYNTLNTEEKLSNLLIGERYPILWYNNNDHITNKNSIQNINNSNEKNLSNEIRSLNYKHILNGSNYLNNNNSNNNNLLCTDHNLSSESSNNLLNKNNSSNDNLSCSDHLLNKNNISDNNLLSNSSNNMLNKINSSNNNLSCIDHLLNKNNISDNNLLSNSSNNMLNKSNSSNNNLSCSDHLLNKNNISDNNLLSNSSNNMLNKNNSSNDNLSCSDHLLNKNNISDNNLLSNSSNNMLNTSNSSNNNLSCIDHLLNKNNISDNNLLSNSSNNMLNKSNSSNNNLSCSDHLLNKNNISDNNLLSNSSNNMLNKSNSSNNNLSCSDNYILNNNNNNNKDKDKNQEENYNEEIENKVKKYINENKIYNEEKIKEDENQEGEKKSRVEEKSKAKENEIYNKNYTCFNKNCDMEKKLLNKSKSLQEKFYYVPNELKNDYKNDNSLTKCLSETDDYKNNKKLCPKSKLNYYFEYRREKEEKNEFMKKEKKNINNYENEGENSSFEKREIPLKIIYEKNKFNSNETQTDDNDICKEDEFKTENYKMFVDKYMNKNVDIKKNTEEKTLSENIDELEKYIDIKNKNRDFKLLSENEKYQSYNILNGSDDYHCSRKTDFISFIPHYNKKTKVRSEKLRYYNNIKKYYSLSDREEIYGKINTNDMKKIINKIEESVEKKKNENNFINDYGDLINKKKGSSGKNENESEDDRRMNNPLNNFISLSSKMHYVDKHKLKRSILCNSLKRYNTYNYTYKNVAKLNNCDNFKMLLKKKMYSSSNIYDINVPIKKCLKTFKSFNRMIAKNKKYFLDEKTNRKRNSFNMYNKDTYSDTPSQEIFEKEKEHYHLSKKKSNKINTEILDKVNRISFNETNSKNLNKNHKNISEESMYDENNVVFYDNPNMINDNNHKKIPFNNYDLDKTGIKETINNCTVLASDEEIDSVSNRKNNINETYINNNNINDNNSSDDVMENSVKGGKATDINKYKKMNINEKINIKNINSYKLEEKGKNINNREFILSNEKIYNEMKKMKNEEKNEAQIKDTNNVEINEELLNKEKNEILIKKEKSHTEISIKIDEKKKGQLEKKKSNSTTNNEEKEISNNNNNNNNNVIKNEEKKKEENTSTQISSKIKRRIIDCKNEKLKWGSTQVIIDIDDTIRSSGGYKFFNYALGGVDAQYQRGETYPGSFQFIFELAMNKLSAESKPLLLSVLTARIPQVPITEDSFLNKKFNEVAERRGIKNWGIDCENKTLYSTLKEWVWNETRGEKKFFNFKQLHKYVIQQNSVVRYIWIGDTGDMDKQAGEMMIKTFPQRIRAVFLHHVKGKDDNTLLPSDYFIKSVPIFFFRTYIGAATKAHAYNLIDKKGLTRVLVQAVLDLEKSKVPSDSSKWEDLIKDIILSNAVDELDKYNAETVNRTKKIIAQKMKEISERKLHFIS